jgi:CHAD domain-containing protein/CYTH domain-containing protein
MPPQVAVDRIGNVLLADAREAVTRLDRGEDDEALHDFRVALRRLRSVLRAFQPYLDHAVPKKTRRRIRDLARATNSARDAEVLLDWLGGRRAELTPSQRIGARWLEEHLTAQRDDGYDVGARAIASDFAGVDRRVRKRLATAARNPWGGSESRATFAVALGELVRTHLQTLQEALDEVQRSDDRQTVHAARIHAKRLRYLLELVAGELGSAASGVKRIKRLQTVLGDLHDMQVGEGAFGAACEDAAAEHARHLAELATSGADDPERRRARRRNPMSGLLALTEQCRGAQKDLFRAHRRWRKSDWPALQQDVAAVLDQLTVVSPAGIEIERKYLLRRVPEQVSSAEAVDVEQGWLPGARLQERLRRVRGSDGDSYFRTVKLGEGLTRLEVEEESSQEIFEHLWPLTEGRRVHKRRYTVSEGGIMWEIDEFLDRELVLAEVELPSPDTDVAVPDWLATVLEREVTGDPKYVNVNLAH